MRLIDVDALQERFFYLNGYAFRDPQIQLEDEDVQRRMSEHRITMASVAKILAEYPTYSGWISVEERLPEIYEVVLIYVDGRMAQAALSYENRWYCTGFGTYIHDSYKVTHWMPLPEPPK